MPTNKELTKVFVDLSEDEQADDFIIEELNKILQKLSAIKSETLDVVNSKIEKASDAVRNDINKFSDGLSSLEKSTDLSVKSIKKYIKEIENNSDVNSIDLKREIRQIKKDISDVVSYSNGLSEVPKKIKSELLEIMNDFVRDTKKSEKEISKDLFDFKEEISKDIKRQKGLGGGSMPLQVSVNSTIANVRYSDINIISSGATIANNDATKKTDITITGSGSGSGYQTCTGTVNGINTTFVFSTAPNAIVVDGTTLQQNEQGGTQNWTGTTTITLLVAPTQSIFAVA